MQSYNLLRETGYEDLITCPIKIDGQSVRQRLAAKRRDDLRRLKAQELSVLKFIHKVAVLSLYVALWLFIRLVWGLAYTLDKLTDGILYTAKHLTKGVSSIKLKLINK